MNKKGKKTDMTQEMLPLAKTADELFSIDDREPRQLNVPEWGFSIMIQDLDARKMAMISRSTTDEKGEIDSLEFSSRVILEGVVKPPLEPRHLEVLKGRSHAAFLRVFNAINSKKKEPSNS